MKLVVFDLDGTLARTSAVDAECYARALVDTLGIQGVETDWNRYEHVTDEGILAQLFMEHFGRVPVARERERILDRFVDLLADRWAANPTEFAEVPGAGSMVAHLLDEGGWTVALATGGWRQLAEWYSPIWACTLLCLLTLAAAAAISLHTPILTSRNMIVVLPALYVIAAELTSSLMGRWGAAVGAMYLAAQAGLMSQSIVAYYTKEMKEQWRDSAALVLHTPGCESGTIHVYGDSANYRFFTKSVRPQLRLIEIPEGATKDLGHEPPTSCPILLWVVGWAWNADDLGGRLGLSAPSFGVADFYGAFVVFRNPPYT